MTDDPIEMPCLGRPFRLGMLYDCRSEKLIPGMTLWDNDVLHKARTENHLQTGSKYEVIAEDTIKEKSYHLEVDATLKLSLMGGLVSVSGAANYLDDRKTSKNVARVSLLYKSTSKFEQLGMDQLGKIQHPQLLESNIATHVVTGVLYGAEAFFVFDRSVSSEESFQKVHGKMEGLIKALPGTAALPIITDVHGAAEGSFQRTTTNETTKFQCKFYGDFVLPENPSTFQDAEKIYKQLPQLPNTVPKKVWLYPLCKLDSKVQQIVREISVGLVNDVQKLLEEIHELEMQSNDIGASDMYQHLKGLREQMSKFRRELSGHRSNLVKRLSVLLPKIRGGGEEEAKLADLLTENGASPFAPQQLSKWLEGKEQEEKLLGSYLARLEKSHFDFIAENDLDALCLMHVVKKVVCFAFKVGGEDDPYLDSLASYMRTGDQPPPVSKVVPWYEDREVKQSMRRQLQMFEEFAKTNGAQDGIKFVVTAISQASSTGKRGAAIILYNDGNRIEFEPPSQPGSPSVTKVLHDRVTIEWSKPTCGSDSIKSYTVLYHSAIDPGDQWMTCKTTGPVASAMVDRLAPESTYFFKVRAECEAGFSPESDVSKPVTTKLEPPRIIKISHDSITIRWSKPAGVTTGIMSYTIFYSSTTGPGDQWTSQETLGPVLSTTVRGLSPQTTYTFKLRAKCEDGFSPESEISSPVTTKSEPASQPGTPRVTNVSHNNITIEWSKPDHGTTASITRYIVFYRSTTDQRDQWITHTTIGPQLSFTVSGLAPQTQYVFKVRAESSVGFSPESHTSALVTTELETPSQPGTPHATTKVFHDNVTITWSKPKHGADNITNYTVFYRSTCNPGDKWMNQKTGNALTSATVTSLTAETTYCFKVRAECDSGFSPESGISTPVCTMTKPENRVAVTVKESQAQSKCIDQRTEPHTYQLLTTDFMRDQKSKIAKCLIGSPDRRVPAPERILMVVGATGAGKSTLINGLANYILGVKWEDDFRFKLIADEGKKSQAESQTEWITAYTFHLRDSSRVSFTLTVIDTPGFGDCRGIERDRQIVEQIKHFFSIRREHGIDRLHGVGFVVPASMARLTPSQRYIFDSVLSIYGKDIEDNIFMMVTFADASQPPVLDSMKQANLPHQKHFKFNNSALYAKHASGGFDKMFWKLGVQTFGDFLGEFENAEARSLTLTRDVLMEREHLENVVQALQPQIHSGLSKMEQLRQQTEVVEQNKALIEQNKEFSYTVLVPKSRKKDKASGEHVTNCLECNYTCHKKCAFANDKDKQRCSAMRNGSCMICSGKCHWTKHVNQPFWYELYEEQETRTSEDLKQRYDTAAQAKSRAEAMIANMRRELIQVEDDVLRMVSDVQRSLKRLDEIALKPSPLTVMEYIDLLIEGEKQEAKPGFMERVCAYQQVKERAKLMATVQHHQWEKGSVFSSFVGDGALSVKRAQS